MRLQVRSIPVASLKCPLQARPATQPDDAHHSLNLPSSPRHHLYHHHESAEENEGRHSPQNTLAYCSLAPPSRVSRVHRGPRRVESPVFFHVFTSQRLQPSKI